MWLKAALLPPVPLPCIIMPIIACMSAQPLTSNDKARWWVVGDQMLTLGERRDVRVLLLLLLPLGVSLWFVSSPFVQFAPTLYVYSSMQ